MADQFKDNIIDWGPYFLTIGINSRGKFSQQRKNLEGKIKEERTKKYFWRPKTKGPLHSSHISIAIKSIPILSILMLEFTFYILRHYFFKMSTLNYLFSKLIQ